MSAGKTMILIEGKVVGGLPVQDKNFFIGYGQTKWVDYSWLETSKSFKLHVESGNIKVLKTKNASNKEYEEGNVRRSESVTKPVVVDESINMAESLHRVEKALREINKKMDGSVGVIAKMDELIEAVKSGGVVERYVENNNGMSGKAYKMNEPVFVPDVDMSGFGEVNMSGVVEKSESGVGSAVDNLRKLRKK